MVECKVDITKFDKAPLKFRRNRRYWVRDGSLETLECRRWPVWKS